MAQVIDRAVSPARTANAAIVPAPHQRRTPADNAASAPSVPPTMSKDISTFVVGPSASPPPVRRPTAASATASAAPKRSSGAGLTGSARPRATTGRSGGAATEDKASGSPSGGADAAERQDHEHRQQRRRDVGQPAALGTAERAGRHGAAVEL